MTIFSYNVTELGGRYFFSKIEIVKISPINLNLLKKPMPKSLVQLTAKIVQSQSSVKQMTTEEVKTALKDTFPSTQVFAGI